MNLFKKIATFFNTVKPQAPQNGIPGWALQFALDEFHPIYNLPQKLEDIVYGNPHKNECLLRSLLVCKRNAAYDQMKGGYEPAPDVFVENIFAKLHKWLHTREEQQKLTTEVERLFYDPFGAFTAYRAYAFAKSATERLERQIDAIAENPEHPLHGNTADLEKTCQQIKAEADASRTLFEFCLKEHLLDYFWKPAYSPRLSA